MRKKFKASWKSRAIKSPLVLFRANTHHSVSSYINRWISSFIALPTETFSYVHLFVAIIFYPYWFSKSVRVADYFYGPACCAVYKFAVGRGKFTKTILKQIPVFSLERKCGANVGVLAIFSDFKCQFVFGGYLGQDGDVNSIQLGWRAFDAVVADCLVDNGCLALFRQYFASNLGGVRPLADACCIFWIRLKVIDTNRLSAHLFWVWWAVTWLWQLFLIGAFFC